MINDELLHIRQLDRNLIRNEVFRHNKNTTKQAKLRNNHIKNIELLETGSRSNKYL